MRRIVTGKDGSIWILRELTTPDLVDRWEVYDGDGELQGVVLISDGKASPIPWQPRLNILRVTRDEVWGTTINTSRCHTSIGIG